MKFRQRSSVSAPPQTFFSHVQIAPDGSCLLAASDDQSLSLFGISDENGLAQYPGWTQREHCDFDWFPFMSYLAPETCCLVSTAKGQPVKILDAFYGNTRASYATYDHHDALLSPSWVNFSQCGQLLLCAYDSQVRVLNVQRPGNQSDSESVIKLSSSRSSRDGIKGRISALSQDPSRTDTLAVGTFAATSNCSNLVLMDKLDCNIIDSLQIKSSGICQIDFIGDLMIVGSRQAKHSIQIFDSRYLQPTPLFRLERDAQTQQRLHYSIASEKQGAWLISGDVSGTISGYDLSEVIASQGNCAQEIQDTQTICDTFSISQAHTGNIGGISYNDVTQTLATCSGQRWIDDVDADQVADYCIKLWSVAKS